MLSANLDMKVKDLLGNSDYNTHKNLINHIFSNEANFYTNNQIDYTKIIQELSNNGVLKLNLPSTQNVSITFNVNKYPKKSSKNLTDILKALGQHNFVVQEEIVVNNNLKWTIQVKTAAAISPQRMITVDINGNIGNHRQDEERREISKPVETAFHTGYRVHSHLQQIEYERDKQWSQRVTVVGQTA
jgi:hypothetical protein